MNFRESYKQLVQLHMGQEQHDFSLPPEFFAEEPLCKCGEFLERNGNDYYCPACGWNKPDNERED